MGIFDDLFRSSSQLVQWILPRTEYPVYDNESPSPLEQLPEELVWKIIQCAPDAIPSLRLTSHLICHRVDTYCISRNNLVQHTIFRMPPADPGNIHISMIVPKYESTLFELRRKLLDPSISALLNLLGPISRDFVICRNKESDSMIAYTVSFDVARGDELPLQLLGELIGNSTGIVHHKLATGLTAMPVVSKILKGIKFGRLNVSCRITTENDFKHIVHLIKEHNVNCLQLATWKVDLSHPAMFIDLASYLRSMHFIWYGHKVDWASIFTEMLSLKLDRFEMCCETHLDDEIIDALRASLPNIGKNINFSVWCANCRNNKGICIITSNEKLEYSVNNHDVRVDRSCGKLDVIRQE